MLAMKSVIECAQASTDACELIKTNDVQAFRVGVAIAERLGLFPDVTVEHRWATPDGSITSIGLARQMVSLIESAAGQ